MPVNSVRPLPRSGTGRHRRRMREATMVSEPKANGPAPRILAVGEEPPPLESTAEATRRRASKGSKAKGKHAGERFAVLNAFVDFALAELSRAEIAVWLVLYRDTRDGTARTSY